MGDQTVMFCVGANKAGTSWLHRYLSRHPDCRLPHLKELHYFDALAFGRIEAEKRRVRKLRDDLAAKAAGADAWTARRLAERMAELDDWLAVLGRDGVDLAAYRAFLTERAGTARLIGDITPAYALLPEDMLARMDAIAPRVRFLYLLRDPVDRAWSNIRMNARRAADSLANVGQTALAMFDAWCEGREDAVWKRSDYAGALTRLRAAVRPEGLMVAYYETLFSHEALDRICAFLGIGPAPAPLAERVHTGVPVTLDAGRRARAQALLAPQYDFVRSTVGDLPARWRENMAGM